MIPVTIDTAYSAAACLQAALAAQLGIFGLPSDSSTAQHFATLERV